MSGFDIYYLIPLLGLFLAITLILIKSINILIKKVIVAFVFAITYYTSIISMSLNYMSMFDDKYGISFLLAFLGGSIISIISGLLIFFILIDNDDII